jgi:hypothetical protein
MTEAEERDEAPLFVLLVFLAAWRLGVRFFDDSEKEDGDA